jgi:hypothetical protein
MGELRILFFIVLFFFCCFLIKRLWRSPKFDSFCKSFSKDGDFPVSTDELIEEAETVDKAIENREDELIQNHKRIKADADRLSKLKSRKDIANGENKV